MQNISECMQSIQIEYTKLQKENEKLKEVNQKLQERLNKHSKWSKCEDHFEWQVNFNLEEIN